MSTEPFEDGGVSVEGHGKQRAFWQRGDPAIIHVFDANDYYKSSVKNKRLCAAGEVDYKLGFHAFQCCFVRQRLASQA